MIEGGRYLWLEAWFGCFIGSEKWKLWRCLVEEYWEEVGLERVREMRVYALEGEEILVMNVGGLYKNFMGGEGFDHEEKYED